MSVKRFVLLSCILILFQLALTGNLIAADGSMICGKNIISVGDSKYLLISRFGQPDSSEVVSIIHHGDSCIKEEEWVYICRRHIQPKMYIIRIVDSKIVSIKLELHFR